jgi:56kDa selenium binding protein (SBP56)
VALIDHDTFEVTGAWETDRGDQFLAYDVWWHLNADVAITSEWATPSMIENGLNPEDLLGKRFGHHLDFWSLSEGGCCSGSTSAMSTRWCLSYDRLTIRGRPGVLSGW